MKKQKTLIYRIMALILTISMVMPTGIVFAEDDQPADGDNTPKIEEKVDETEVKNDEGDKSDKPDDSGKSVDDTKQNDSDKTDDTQGAEGQTDGSGSEEGSEQKKEPPALKAAPGAKAVNVKPTIGIRAPYFRFSEASTLPSKVQFSVHIKFTPEDGGSGYTFDRDITKVYENFEGKTTIPTGKYTADISIGTSGSQKWEYSGDSSVTVYLNENGNLYWNEEMTDPCRFQFDFTGNYEFPIKINVIDKDDGHKLTDAEIGDGIDINYVTYWTRYYRDTGRYNPSSGNLPLSRLFQAEGQKLKVTSQGQLLEVEVPDAPGTAYENDTFNLRIQSEEIYSGNYGSYKSEEPTRDTEVFYFGHATYAKDGWPYAEPGDKYSLHKENDEFTLDVIVDQDLLDTPSVNIKTDGPAAKYPVKVEVTMQRNTTSDTYRPSSYGSASYVPMTTLFGEPEIQKTIVTVDGPGENLVSMPFKTINNKSAYHMAWRVVDESGEYDTDWDSNGEEYVNRNDEGALWDVYHYKGYDYENWYTDYSDGEALIAFRYAKVNGVSLPFHAFFADDGEDPDRFFPVYLKVELEPIYGGSTNTYTAVKKLESAEDAHSKIVFEEAMPKGVSYNMTYTFYANEELTAKSDFWQSGSMEVGLDEQNRLVSGGAWGGDQPQEAASIIFYQLGTYFDVTAFRAPDDLFPKYVSIEMKNRQDSSIIISEIRKVENAGDQGEVYFDYMGFGNDYYNSVWFVKTGVYNKIKDDGTVSEEDLDSNWINHNYQSYGSSWEYDSGDKVSVVSDGLVKCYNNRYGDYSYYYRKNKNGYFVANPEWLGSSLTDVKLPIKTTVKDGKEADAFKYSPQQRLDVRLERVTTDTSGYSSRSTVAQREFYISEAGDTNYTISSLRPGTYYITFFTERFYHQNQWYEWWPKMEGWTESRPNGDVVTLTEDGRFLAEDGSEYFVNNRYTGTVPYGSPKLFVETTVPDGVSNIRTTMRVRLTGVAGTDTAWVNKAGTAIVDDDHFGLFGYYFRRYDDTDPNTNSNYYFFYSYDSGTGGTSYENTIPAGDYDLTYYTIDGSEAPEDGSGDTISKAWSSDRNIRIHIDENGNVTRDGMPYVIPNYMLGGVSQFTFNVETKVTEGVQHAFTEGDKVRAFLLSREDGILATGEVEVSEEGIKPITLTAIDGKYINPGIGLSGKNDQYYVSFYTAHAGDEGMANPNWHSRMGTYNTGYQPTIQDPLPVYVKSDGKVLSANGGSYIISDDSSASNPVLVLDNYSLLLPFEQSQKPDAVKQTENGEITFNTIKDFSKIKDGSHYMIVTQNKYDGKFYALSYADGKGDQVLLEDINSLDDLESGYILGKDDYGVKPYVFTANKSSYSDSSVTAQFKSGAKDPVSGKSISLKLGSTAQEYLPLLSTSAGNVTVKPEMPISENTSLFSMNKNNYSFVGYNNEFLGFSGFTVFSNRYPASAQVYYDSYTGEDSYFYTTGNYIDINKTSNQNVYIANKPYGAGVNDFVYEVDPKYGTKEYYESLGVDFSNIYPGSGVLSPMSSRFIILTDNQEESSGDIPNNQYKLVKTFGDFNNTFTVANQTSMVLVYTADDGKEYALNPKGLVQVLTKDGSADYRTLSAGADNEFIANNNSRTWTQKGEVTYFGLRPTDIDGTAAQVFAGVYSLRKSRTNNFDGGEYLTMNGNVMGSDDQNYDYNSQIYIMHPTATIRNEVDWGKATSYKMSVMRGGEEVWLGVEDGKMVVVDSEDDAVVFDVYAPTVERYYEASNSDEFNPYYKASTLDDINADDEILIVYNNNGKKEIVACTTTDWRDYNTYYSTTLYPAVYVSDEDVPVDTSQEDNFPLDFRYYYRTDTYGEVKHVYAYSVSDDLIMAQGGATNAIGSAKGTPTKKQEKYDSVVGLGQNAQYKLWIKEPGWTDLLYYNQKAEVNFFYENGQFYLRGGKADAWLGRTTYTKRVLDGVSNQYVEQEHAQFITVGQDERIPVEIYKRGTLENITVNYYDVNDLDGDSKKSEIKPEGLLGLPQDEDLKHDDEDYIFVGWTKDKDKAGYLDKDESANLFDFDDLSRVASVKQDAKDTYGLLGDCDPEGSNTIKVLAKDLGDDKTLDLYPVYAWRGRTEVVSWDENDKMVIGVSDYKDLQAGHDGNINPRERWLGSIDIEVYRDGELVRSGTRTRASNDNITSRLYFAYHNDDAADLNIKFIADSVTAETLMDYLRDGDFSTTYPSDDYIIDAVYAQQGGSEDGLKYMYNWLDPEVGGQLDNVKGGSTVKIYLTSKYQVKYYFDDDGDGTYDELTDDAHQDDNYYTTPGTEDAVNANTEKADYVVQDKDGNEYRKLMQQTPSDTTRFTDEKIRRGDYSYFQYLFNEYPHVIPVAALPEAPVDKELDSDVWAIKNAQMANTDTAVPEGEYSVTGTTYGTGSTVHSYESEPLNDKTNTFHLYVAVKGLYTSVTVTKVWEDNENEEGYRPSAEDFAQYVTLFAGDEEVTDAVPQITDNGDETYTISYTNLPKYDDDGNEITYSVKESLVDNYGVDGEDSAEDGGTITNVFENSGGGGVTEVEITKVWDDDEDLRGIRPSADEFVSSLHLYADDTEITDHEPVVTDNEDGTYTVKYEGLPVTGDDGEVITYSVREDPVRGYTADNDTAENGGTITNKVDNFMSITVNKNWNDFSDKYGIRPTVEEFKDSIVLLMNGEVFDEVEPIIAVDNENKDRYIIYYIHLPEMIDDVPCKYEVQETKPPEGYQIAGSDTAENGGMITNELDMGDIVITKKLPEYDQNSTSGDEEQWNSGTFVFSIKATLKGEEIFNDVIEFTFEGPDSQTAVLSDCVPVGAVVTVTEIYKGAEYKLESSETVNVEIVSAASGDEQEDAEFTNVYDDTISQGYGINNMYVYVDGVWRHVNHHQDVR